MTQQIRDEIAYAQGWSSRVVPDPMGGMFSSGMTDWVHPGRGIASHPGHPIPNTIDAAVGVIEGAGYTVDDITFTSHGARGYGCVACAVRDNEPYHTSVTVYYKDSLPKQREVFREAIWQLALACVKAGKGGG